MKFLPKTRSTVLWGAMLLVGLRGIVNLQPHFVFCNGVDNNEKQTRTTRNARDHSGLRPKAISPACHVPPIDPARKIERIFFLHMRKAGGTSLRSYLRHLSRKVGLDYLAIEADTPQEFPSPEMLNSTLYVTHLREPVARAISHYKYDQRWNCNILQNKTFDGNYSAAKLDWSLDDFILKSRETKLLFNCGINCFARWSTGLFNDQFKESRQLEELARNVLWSYDLIIVEEKLKDPHYVKQIERLFGGVSGADRRSDAYCSAASRTVNKLFPLVVENASVDLIREHNQIDLALYKELTTCDDGFNFSNHSLIPLGKKILRRNEIQETKDSSPVCTFSSDKTLSSIYFLDLWHAGGLGVKNYLSEVAKQFDVNFVSDYSWKSSRERMNSTTLYVTLLKDPIDRFLDHYRFNQRWNCAQLETNSFKPSLANTQNITIEEFAFVDLNKAECGMNCYARYGTGHWNHLEAESEFLYFNAHQMFWKYDLIISYEKLQSDPSYVKSLETLFGGVVGLNHTVNSKCATKSKEANERFPLKVSDETVQQIREWNQIDIKLYDELMSCPNGHSFPTKSIV